MFSKLLLTLILDCMLVAAMPEPTTAAKYVERQQALSNIYSPSLSGTVVVYEPYKCSTGSAVATSASFWRCCDTATGCSYAQSCVSGTVYFQSTSAVCSQAFTNAAYSRCGTEYLFMSQGAAQGWAHVVCAEPTDTTTDYTYLVVPPSTSRSNAPLFSGTSSSPPPTNPTTTQPPPSSHSQKSTPIGAIVGGVVGGVAVLAIIAGTVFFFLKKRGKQENFQAATPLYHDSSYPSNLAPTENKHASIATTMVSPAGSPPPMYPSSAMQHQSVYGYADPSQPPVASPASYGYSPEAHTTPLASPHNNNNNQHFINPAIELPNSPN